MPNYRDAIAVLANWNTAEWEDMFYACLSIMMMVAIMIACVMLSVIDLETYNFGLYIVLLCIVGTMLACALCIANPNACQNPAWYTNMCILIQEMHPNQTIIAEYSRSTGVSEMTALRNRMAFMLAPPGTDTRQFPLRQESRATVAMLAPAVHIMHQVWRGMAWVAEEIDEEEEGTKSFNPTEDQDQSNMLLSQSDSSNAKRLSTIAESSTDSQVYKEMALIDEEMDSSASRYNSSHDIIV